MDTHKLLEIITLLEADEEQYTIGARINELQALIAQNNDTSGQQASDKLETLLSDLRATRSAIFGITERGILERIGSDQFFGIGLIDHLQKITNASRGYEVNKKLATFKDQRAEKYSKLKKLKNALEETGFEPYKQEAPEVALALPEDLLDIDAVTKYLKKFGEFVHAVQEAVLPDGAERKVLKIVRLNKGSGEFFLSVDPHVAKAILETLADLATIYLTVREIGTPRNEKLNDDEQVIVNKVYAEIAKNRIEDFLKKAPEKIAKNANLSQKENIKIHLKGIMKWLEKGIKLEVLFEKSTEVNTGKTEDELKEIKELQARQLSTAQMYQLPKTQLQLAPEEEDGDLDSKKKKAQKID